MKVIYDLPSVLLISLFLSSLNHQKNLLPLTSRPCTNVHQEHIQESNPPSFSNQLHNLSPRPRQRLRRISTLPRSPPSPRHLRIFEFRLLPNLLNTTSSKKCSPSSSTTPPKSRQPSPSTKPPAAPSAPKTPPLKNQPLPHPLTHRATPQPATPSTTPTPTSPNPHPLLPQHQQNAPV